MKDSRSYRMRARAVSARATGERIIGAMLAMCLDRWYDEVTLRDVAERAGVALQTVVNHFGTKEGLLAAMLADPRVVQEFGGQRLTAVPGDIPAAVGLLVADYEHAGDAAIRFLALESRVPALAPVLAFGRGGHHDWVERTFPAALAGLTGSARDRRLALLVCVTDVYTWHLLRRDQGMTRDGTAAAMTELVLALHPGGQPPAPGQGREP